MIRLASSILVALLLSSAAYAATTPSKASLSGKYFFQVTTVNQVSWFKTVSATCFGTKYTLNLGGQSVGTELYEGVVNFTGSGTFSLTMTQFGNFDQTSSNNTVSITCTGNKNSPYTYNNGSAIFFGPQNATASGTYTVNSDGTGVMNVSGPDAVVLTLSLGQFSSAGVAQAALIRQTTDQAGAASSGIAIHQ